MLDDKITSKPNLRIPIFTVENSDQEGLSDAVFDVFSKEFPNYRFVSSFDYEGFVKEDSVRIQCFESFAESAEKNYSINGIGELFTIIDRKLNPRNPYARPSLKDGLLSASYELSINVCKQKEIPYLIYEGELKRPDSSPEELRSKLRLIIPQVNVRFISLR